jgi:hypothetical protein
LEVRILTEEDVEIASNRTNTTINPSGSEVIELSLFVPEENADEYGLSQGRGALRVELEVSTLRGTFSLKNILKVGNPDEA